MCLIPIEKINLSSDIFRDFFISKILIKLETILILLLLEKNFLKDSIWELPIPSIDSSSLRYF